MGSPPRFMGTTGKTAVLSLCLGIFLQASVYGRIDIFRSVYIKLDSLRVTMAKDSYSSTIPPASFK